MRKYILTAILLFSGICFAQSIEDELRLLGGDEFILEEIKKIEPKKDTAKIVADTANITQTDSAQIAGTEATQSVSAEENADRRGRQTAAQNSIETAPVISVFDTAGVTAERSIDFARNLDEYRSPQRALFASLLIPGLGQAYNKKYWRTGLYAAIEIGMIAGAIHFNNESKNARKKAEKFADENFSKKRLEDFYTKLDSEAFKIYGNDTIANWLIFGVNSGFVNDTVSSAINKFLAELDNDFYGRIYGAGSRRFSVQGWSDMWEWDGKDMASKFFNNGDFDRIFVENDSIAYENVLARGNSVFGVSGMQNTFLEHLDYSRLQSRRSSVFIVGIFVNHIASAADAFVTAIIHNRRLLKEESGENLTKAEEILSRISIESDMYFDSKSDLTTKLGFVWRF